MHDGRRGAAWIALHESMAKNMQLLKRQLATGQECCGCTMVKSAVQMLSISYFKESFMRMVTLPSTNHESAF